MQEDIWTVRDEDGNVQYTIERYDKNGCQTRRLAAFVTAQEGTFLLIRPISYGQQAKWRVPTVSKCYTIGQTERLAEDAAKIFSAVFGLKGAKISLRSRSVDTACLNEVYTAVVSDLAQLVAPYCEKRSLEFSFVSIRQWINLCRQGLFDPQDFPYTDDLMHYIGKGIRDKDIYDLPGFQNS